LPKVWYKQNWIWIGENYERICLKKKIKNLNLPFGQVHVGEKNEGKDCTYILGSVASNPALLR
jgi:hypothetical protein